MSRTLRLGREAALWAGGILGTLCFLAVLGGWLFNVTPLVFASGSMTPAYGVGSLGIAHEVPVSELGVGDVVSVRDARGSRVTHRIVGIDARGDGAALTLKGDTNDVVDAQTYEVTRADRVVLDVPYAGYVVAAASSPAGLAAGGLLAIGLLVLAFGPRTGPGQGQGSGGARRHALVGTGAVAVLVVGGGLGLSGQAPWAFTSAAWTDSATADATVTATAPAPVAPVLSCSVVGTNGDWKVKLDWTYSPDPTTKFVVRSNGTGVPGTPVDVAKTLRTWTSAGFTSRTGQVWVVAVNGVTEVESTRISFDFGPGAGNGNKLCPVP